MIPNYLVAQSPIHGLGVFARKPIRRGQRIGVIRGWTEARLGPGRGPRYMIELEEGLLTPRGEPAGLWRMNHSCSPNAALRDKHRSVDVIALRAIPAGAEITCDYRPSFHEGRLRCRCGSSHCAGRI